MALIVLAITTVLVLWWASTVLILYLDGLPRRTFRWSIAVVGVIAVLGGATLAATAGTATPAGALAAFAAALAIWGLNELLFLTGLVTGPVRTQCPPGLRGLARFNAAAGAVIFHELALAGSLAAVFLLTAGGENTVGFWTFLVLFVMRLSAKLNIFLGVPNPAAELLPAQLAYLKSYFRVRPMNPLFPVSVTVASAVVGWLIFLAVTGGEFAATSNVLLATLLALAVLEHWLLVLPIPAAALWRWGLSSREGEGADALPVPETVVVHPAVRNIRG